MLDLDLDAVTVHQPRGAVDSGVPGLDWAQETDTVTLYVALSDGVRGRDLDVQIRADSLKIAHKRSAHANDLSFSASLGGRCRPSESEWEVVRGELVMTLHKEQQREWVHAISPASLQHVSPTPNGGSSTASTAAPADAATGSAADLTTPAPAPRPIRATDGANSSAHAPGTPGKALADQYRSWDRFDDIGALTELENQGKSADEPEWALRSSKGVAAVQCSSYVKDKEEVARTAPNPPPSSFAPDREPTPHRRCRSTRSWLSVASRCSGASTTRSSMRRRASSVATSCSRPAVRATRSRHTWRASRRWR